jgi:hypothetical protein
MPQYTRRKYSARSVIGPFSEKAAFLQHTRIHVLTTREPRRIDRTAHGKLRRKTIVKRSPASTREQLRQLAELRLVILALEPKLPQHVTKENR